MTKIQMFPIGTTVNFGEEFKCIGTIKNIHISKTSIVYDVYFWKGDELRSLTLEDDDFIVDKKQKRTSIGFVENV